MGALVSCQGHDVNVQRPLPSPSFGVVRVETSLNHGPRLCFIPLSVRFGYGGLHLTSVARALPEGGKFKSRYKWPSRFLPCQDFDPASLAEGLRGLHLQAQKPEPLLHLLMGFTLAHLLLLLLGWDPLAPKLRPCFEVARPRPRHGTQKILSALSIALYLLAGPCWSTHALWRFIAILSRLANGRGLALHVASLP